MYNPDFNNDEVSESINTLLGEVEPIVVNISTGDLVRIISVGEWDNVARISGIRSVTVMVIGRADSIPGLKLESTEMLSPSGTVMEVEDVILSVYY